MTSGDALNFTRCLMVLHMSVSLLPRSLLARQRSLPFPSNVNVVVTSRHRYIYLDKDSQTASRLSSSAGAGWRSNCSCARTRVVIASTTSLQAAAPTPTSSNAADRQPFMTTLYGTDFQGTPSRTLSSEYSGTGADHLRPRSITKAG
jgi:hypothetical protein